MFDNINVIMTPADAFNTFTIHWPLFRLQSIEGRIICSLNELTSTNNAGHEDFMHAALGEWERDGAGVDGETGTLVHLLEGHFLSMLQEPGRNILMRHNHNQEFNRNIHQRAHDKVIFLLLLDDVQALVYAGPGPLYAAHFDFPLRSWSLLSIVPSSLAFRSLLWL